MAFNMKNPLLNGSAKSRKPMQGNYKSSAAKRTGGFITRNGEIQELMGSEDQITKQARDIIKVENEFQTINYSLNYGKILCVPIYPLLDELITIEKQSPKMAGYINKRLESLNWKIRMGKI